jgi:hypothetical protein
MLAIIYRFVYIQENQYRNKSDSDDGLDSTLTNISDR